MRFDFITYDSEERPTLIVEAKRRSGTSEAWATELRRNILARGNVPPARYFAVVVPDRLYLWRAEAPPEAAPEQTDMRPIFRPYFARIATDPGMIEPLAFEQIVAWWLEDLAEGTGREGDLRSLPAPFVEAVHGGRVRREVAA